VKPAEPKTLKITPGDNGVVSISLNRGPVNALNLEVLQEILAWVHYLGNEESTKAILLQSSIDGIFSAGLDITEFINPDKARFEQFWSSLQEVWMLMTSFPKVLVAAISGHSPAGGCLLAMTADYRVMVSGPAERPYRIGLNEVPVGITVPPWLINHFASIVGPRTSERMLQLGELVTAEQALRIGLVDEVVSDSAALEASTKAAIARFLSVPDQGRWMTKDMSRRDLFRFLSEDEDRKYDLEFFAKFVQHPDIQKNIATYKDGLKNKK
jgi:3,2-trans-enoyl-CoA isomerase